MDATVYEVGQVNTYIKNMFRQDYFLNDLSVKGEISNCKYHSSGHIYFTLKDSRGTLNCAMWASYTSSLRMRLQDGLQVVAKGSVDIYEKTGQYQLICKRVEPDGRGALYEQYERLKQELSEAGMFDESYKQPIPRMIKTLGVVTAPTGAAVRDILNIAKRRNPYLQIILYPALVQGEGAAASIVKGIKALERYGVDCMIVGRGGGSIEDLWAFNERAVAQAIFDCSIPIISAVGHETDFTIADFVADKRASTPSAGAELAVMEVAGLLDRIHEYEASLNRAIHRKLDRSRLLIQNYARNLGYLSPEAKINRLREDISRLSDGMNQRIEKKVTVKKQSLLLLCERLKGLSPLEKISSGYAFVSGEDGKRLRSVDQVETGDSVIVNVVDGQLITSVVSKLKR